MQLRKVGETAQTILGINNGSTITSSALQIWLWVGRLNLPDYPSVGQVRLGMLAALHVGMVMNSEAEQDCR